MKEIHALKTDETGAVTVDWVVLTAGLVGLAFATATILNMDFQNINNGMREQSRDNGISASSYINPARWTAEANGSFVISTNGGDLPGTFMVAGTGINYINDHEGATIGDTQATNGTNSMLFDVPSSEILISMTSIHPSQTLSNAQVILADGSRVPVTDRHFTTGQNPLGLNDLANGNGDPVIINGSDGNYSFRGSADQSELTFFFNDRNISGLSPSNGIVGFEYDQNSTHSGETVYVVYTEGKPYKL